MAPHRARSVGASSQHRGAAGVRRCAVVSGPSGWSWQRQRLRAQGPSCAPRAPALLRRATLPRDRRCSERDGSCAHTRRRSARAWSPARSGGAASVKRHTDASARPRPMASAGCAGANVSAARTASAFVRSTLARRELAQQRERARDAQQSPASRDSASEASSEGRASSTLPVRPSAAPDRESARRTRSDGRPSGLTPEPSFSSIEPPR